MDTLKHTLSGKKDAFSPELFRQLSEELRAQTAGASGSKVQLDFDPFVWGDTWEMPDRWVARRVTASGGRYLVRVYYFLAGRGDYPTVIPELAFRDGRWVFVNVHYPNSNQIWQDHYGKIADLLGALTKRRLERRQHSK